MSEPQKKKRSYADREPVRYDPSMLAGRVPPHDLDAEAAVLAAMLLNREAVTMGLSLLLPEHFYSDANCRIFEAITDLNGNGIPCDIISVASWLRDREKLAQIGGASYLAQVSDATPAVAHIAAHAATVIEKWQLRCVIASCQKISSEGYGDVGVVSEFLSSAAECLSQIAVSSRTALRGVTARAGITALFQQWTNPKKIDGMGTGIPDLDSLLRTMRRKQLIVIGAHSGIGKSALATCIAGFNTRFVGEEGERYGGVVITVEMGHEEYLQRMVFSDARVDSYKFEEKYREKITDDDWQRIAKSSSSLAVDHLIVIDDMDDATEIAKELQRIKVQYEEQGTPLRYVIWDYSQILSPGGSSGRRVDSREQEVSAVARICKKVCQQMNITGILLAQLNEDGRKDGRKPRGRDMRESKGLLNEANAVILIYNPHADERSAAYHSGATPERSYGGEQIDLIVDKNRGGTPGTVKAVYYPQFTAFGPFTEGMENVKPIPEDHQPVKTGGGSKSGGKGGGGYKRFDSK
jgi:replicative DNA helicase